MKMESTPRDITSTNNSNTGVSGVEEDLLTWTSPELSAFQVKADMEKTLQWLVPLAANTTKAHQGFGWVGEWANSGVIRNRDCSFHSQSAHFPTDKGMVLRSKM
ncbi:hypothetical protein EZV62_003916 [Acer yangbiense]|uniref:DUF668 domain-containing protein n=1 Tax=Acer yangbiense TaxID=1000413 RepID=A0A5C7IIL8_9ROSI|nr:hypothetical protein EZV62_003916 [Acer yangbiense]